jgi:ribonucleoside-diphosphate reductase alpha chain
MLFPYTRRKKINPNDANAKTDFVDQNGDHWQEFEVYHPKVKMWMKKKRSIQTILKTLK